MEKLVAKLTISHIGASDAPMCSRSEMDEIIEIKTYSFEKTEEYRLTPSGNYVGSEPIYFPDQEGIWKYLTLKSSIWVLDSAQNIFRADKNPALNFQSEEAYFLSLGWSNQPEPLFEVRFSNNKQVLEEVLEEMQEGWGD